jgi:NADH-quinone oxidoreductase subunit M
MTELHFPWLEFAILVPFFGALFVWWLGDRQAARNWSSLFCALTLFFALGEWIDFSIVGAFEAHDHWDVITFLFHQDIFVVDELSAPLLPLGALIYLVTVLSTPRTKAMRFSFAWTLAAESVLIATLSCRASWVLILLLSIAVFPPWLEMKRRERCTRVYTLHMGLFVGLLVAGYGLYRISGGAESYALVAGAILAAAALLRSGVLPVHVWTTDLFEKATFGTAVLFLTPLTGAYTVMRLVVPIAPDWALRSIAIMSVLTALYCSGMALVQTKARRFYCYLLLSNASLVLVGMELSNAVGLTGALCVWLSVGISLTGFSLTLRSIESRIGRIVLSEYHGLFQHMPGFAGFFLLTGLASIGFPGTIGFVAMELLVEGAVEVYPVIGACIVITAALNGIAVLHAYFRIFTGRKSSTQISLVARRPERVSIFLLTVLIVGGGLVPGPGIASRYHAAMELIQHREVRALPIPESNDKSNRHP